MLAIDTQAPSFSLPDQNGQIHTLEEYRGKKVILDVYKRQLHGKFALHISFHHGQVFARKPARVQLFLQKLAGVGVFGRAHQAACALVQPVERTENKLSAKRCV